MPGRYSYLLDIKDRMSGPFKRIAKTGTESLKRIDKQSSATGVGLKKLGGILAATFAVGQLRAWSEENERLFDIQEKSEAKLKAILKTTQGISGQSFEGLRKQAAALQSVTLFGDEATIEMQALLATFKNIRGEVFTQTIPLIQDMATVLNTDLKGASIQVGKALNDPAKGLSALSEAGITFTTQQANTIKTLQESGRVADAQRIILAELRSEFGGAAQAAARAGGGPLQQFSNAVGDLRERFGGVTNELKTKLLPAGYAFIGFLDRSLSFMKHNKELILGLVAGIGAIATALGLWRLAQIGVNIAMAPNPIGLVILGLGALVAAIVYAWVRFEKFRATVKGLWAAMKAWVRGIKNSVLAVLGGLGNIMVGIFTFDLDRIKAGFKQAKGAMQQQGAETVQAFKSAWDNELAKKPPTNPLKALSRQASSGRAAPGNGVAGAGLTMPQAATPVRQAAATGGSVASLQGDIRASRNLTISINKLIETFHIQTDSIKESPAQIKGLVTPALLQAINNGNLVFD
jgi:phage-related minor tail protein